MSGKGSKLLIRYGDTVASLQPRDLEEIKEAVGVVEETFQSFGASIAEPMIPFPHPAHRTGRASSQPTNRSGRWKTCGQIVRKAILFPQ